MLSHSRPFAKAFCSLVTKRNQQKNRCRIGVRDHLYVFAESRFQDHHQRADIVLLNRNERGTPKWAIVVEAKSWNRSVSDFENIDNQVEHYREAIQKEWKLSCPVVPVLLIQPGSGLASSISTVLSWDDIRSIVNNCKSSDRLVAEFKTFLAGDTSMTTFEREVLTVAAGDTYEFVKRHYVYTCPPPGKGRAHKRFLYLAVREGQGGRMELLFKVIRHYTLPKKMEEIAKMQIDNADMKQIRSYWTDPEVVKFAAKDYKDVNVVQFYVLDKTKSIQLKTPMKPKKGNWRGNRYLELVDFFGSCSNSELVPAR